MSALHYISLGKLNSRSPTHLFVKSFGLEITKNFTLKPTARHHLPSHMPVFFFLPAHKLIYDLNVAMILKDFSIAISISFNRSFLESYFLLE